MNVQTEKYFQPVREINTLALENVEKLLDLQLRAINDTARISVERLKSAADIKDAEGLKKYFAEQTELTKTLGERFVQDAQTALELGASYSDKVQQVMADTVKTETTRKAAPKAKQTQEKQTQG